MDLRDQYRQRRKALSFTQQDVASRTGMVRQQYQRLERGGNPRLDTLELAADGLNAKLMLIPVEKWHAVQALLRGEDESIGLNADPWQGLLGDDEGEGKERDGE
ncbi:helix-turn-helix transcriptional regulator [Halomonas campisalis]|uniref:Helix-turn-helix transcriptional regulator n=1 Tax=Billgrantia campisalis TaxID=74661 RepID=A0ABS9PCJ1_9GAMM|nr:helix-turn-helix transcriptional regulator [Halomonas campisalis]MCG6658957.1 helix-turn-helix transcriptional regulator [Halomonas campisalis]MDR5863678.1 helix-turn-helix transcriptional regulator [Halomonas campisalis]